MKKIKSAADLTHKQIVEAWIREYDFMINEDSPRELPDHWPLAVSWDNDFWFGDPLWIMDFTWDKEYATRIEGTFGDIKKRIKNEPRLKKAIEKAVADREAKIIRQREENEVLKKQREEAERIAAIKRMPWISVKTAMPTERSIYIVTDGKNVGTAYPLLMFDENDNFVGVLTHDNPWLWRHVATPVGYSMTHDDVIELEVTHWMPLDRLLLYLPALEMSA
jgi:uncharacterized protein DUF551